MKAKTIARIALIAAIVIWWLLSLTGCVTASRCAAKFPHATAVHDTLVKVDSVFSHDTVYVSKEIKDSTVTTAALKDTGTVPCNTNGTYLFKNEIASVKLTIKNGSLSWNIDISKTESRYKSIISDKERQITELQTSKKVSTHTEVVRLPPIKEQYVPWWAQVCCWIVVLLAVFYAAKYLLFRFTK